MANDAYTQQALANDPSFRRRLKSSGAKIAWQILTEDVGTVGHQQRAIYARSVLANLDAWVATIAGSIVMRTSVFSFATTVSLVQGVPVVVTASGDPDIDAQLANDWSNLAGA